MSLLIVIALSTFVILLFSAFSPYIIKTILQLVFRESVEEAFQKLELSRLSEEIKGVPMIDEFPRYARLERKIQKLTMSISKLSKSRGHQIFYGNIILPFFFYLMQVVFFMWVMYQHRHESVVNVNTLWTYPLHPLLSLFTGLSGVVSAGAWVLICRSAISQLIPHLTELF